LATKNDAGHVMGSPKPLPTYKQVLTQLRHFTDPTVEGSFAEVGQAIAGTNLVCQLFDARHGVKNDAKHGIV